MAARTAVEMGATLNGVLKATNNYGTWGSGPPQQDVRATFLGCVAYISSQQNTLHYILLEDIPGPPRLMRVAVYYKYTVTVSAGGALPVSVDVYCKVGENTGPYVSFPSSIPAGAKFVETDMEVPFSFSVNGIYAGTQIVDAVYDDRMSPKDYTDRTFCPSWYADEDTSCTVAITVPGHGDISLESTGLGYTANQVVDIQPQDLGSTFGSGFTLALSYSPQVNFTYAVIGDPKFSVSAINLESLDLHNPGSGDTPPDASTPNWYFSPPASGGYWHIHNDGGIAIERCVATTTSAISWLGVTAAPYLCSLVFNDGAFTDESGNGLTIEYDCGAVEWDAESESYLPHYFTGDADWDEFHSDWDPAGWQRWSTRTFSAMEKNEWRATNGENVGGGVANENDARAGLKCYPIDSSTWDVAALGSFVWPMISIGLEASIDINDPEDAPSRPSDWQAVSGCSVSGDVWTVSASASSPKVKRVLATRYWLRLNNLQGYSDDPELPRDFNWPIMMRPNINLTNGEDGATIEAAVPYEDEWHWNQYAYLLLGLTAAKAGTVTMQVKYSTVSVYDPCYPSVAYRAAEWEYTRTTHTATYNIDVSAGANSIQVDLCCPTEGGIPELWHVDEVWFTLPDGGEAAEEYTLTGLALTKDTVNSNSLRFRSVRCWQWASNLGFGIGAIHDGKHVLWIGDAYGYSAHRNEKCLSYIQYAQHNPGSTAEGDPSTAKSLARMCNEIGWLRGWNVTYDIDDSDPNVKNEDEDGNVQSSAFYSWDLREAHENSDTIQYGATTVGYWQLLAGTRNRIHVEKFPRGRIEGIVKSEDGLSRQRNLAPAIKIYEGTTLTETVGTDAQGWYRSSPIKEYDKTYKVNTSGSMTAVNREYTTYSVLYGTLGIYDPFLCRDFTGLAWLVGITAQDAGNVKCYSVPGDSLSYIYSGLPFTGAYSRPSIAVLSSGYLAACATNTTTGDMEFSVSKDRGRTWEVITTSTIGTGLELGTIFQNNGQVWLCGWDADKIKLRCGDSTTFAPAELSSDANTYVDVCDATYTTDKPRSSVTELADRRILVAVEDGSGNVGLYFARDLRSAAGFEAV